MDYTTQHITCDKVTDIDKTQFITEGEISLAENNCDIDSILRWDASIIPLETTYENNCINFSGTVNINILCTEKNKNIHLISKDIPITETIPAESTDSTVFVDIRAVISDLRCRKLSNKKISYKISAELWGSYGTPEETDVITSIDDIPKEQQHFETIETTTTQCCSKEIFKITEDIALPPSKPPIGEVLSLEGTFANTEYKGAEDSIDIKGDLLLTLLYTSAEGDFPEVYEFDIPFKENIPSENTDEKSIIKAFLYIKDCFYNISEDEDGESRIINIDADILACTHTSEKNQYKILEDAYVPGSEITFDTYPLDYSMPAPLFRAQCPVKETVTLNEDDPDMLQIFSSCGNVYIDNITLTNNKITIEGIINTDILYITGNDNEPVACHSDTVPFYQTIDARGANENMTADVSTSISHIGFNMLSDRELEMRCAINTVVWLNSSITKDIITDFNMCPLPPGATDKIPGIILYTVKKGDTLWKLAKRFNTTIKDIAELNNIENPDLIYPGEKFIIVKNTN